MEKNSIDLNAIGRSLYNNLREQFDDTNVVGNRLLPNIENLIIKDIAKNLLEVKFDESNKDNIVKSLKDILLLCYIKNINLNNYINLTLDEKDC